MSEEKQMAAKDGKNQADTPPPEKRQKPVFVYLAILFAAAFLLLLFAYLMQQRNSQEILGNLSDLRQSMGNIQSIDQLVEENQMLREESESLRQQLADTQEQLDKVQEELSVSEALAEKAQFSSENAWNIVHAFQSVYTLRQLYEAGDIEGAKALLDGLEESNGTDEVETWLCEALALDPNWPEALETFPPLVEWRELKAAITTETQEEE